MQNDAKPKKGRGTKPRKDQGADRIKMSVLLSRSLDVKLRALAGIRGVDKSTLIQGLLEASTRNIVVSIRGPLGASGGAGEGTAETGETEAA